MSSDLHCKQLRCDLGANLKSLASLLPLLIGEQSTTFQRQVLDILSLIFNSELTALLARL